MNKTVFCTAAAFAAFSLQAAEIHYSVPDATNELATITEPTTIVFDQNVTNTIVGGTTASADVTVTGGGWLKTKFTLSGVKLTVANGANVGTDSSTFTAAFNQSSQEDWGRLVVTNKGYFHCLDATISAKKNTPVPESGYFDFIYLDAGKVQFRQFSNGTTATGRVTVASTSLFNYSGSLGRTCFNKGPYEIVLQNGASLIFNGNGSSPFTTAESGFTTVTGDGDMDFRNNKGSASAPTQPANYIPQLRSGCLIDNSGYIRFGRSSTGSNRCYYELCGSNIFGPNLKGIKKSTNNSAKDFGSSTAGAVSWLVLTDNSENTVKMIDHDALSLAGEGTLRLNACEGEGQSVFKAGQIWEDCAVTIEKIGPYETRVTAANRFPNLVLTEGRLEFAANATVTNFSCAAGTSLAVAEGTIVRFENGFGALANGLKFVAEGGEGFGTGVFDLIYFKGADPDLAKFTCEVGQFRTSAFSIAACETEGLEDYRILRLTVTENSVNIDLTENDAEIDLVGTYGSTQDKVFRVNIPAGVTNYNTTALIGNGEIHFSGGGVFAQAASSPAYTGDIYIGLAAVVVSGDYPFGQENVGKITIQGETDAGGASRLWFKGVTSAGAILPNDIELESTGYAFYFDRPTNGLVVFDGDIDATGLNLSMSMTGPGTGNSISTTERIRFNGRITAAQLLATGRWGYHFKGALDVTTLYPYGDANTPRNTPYFYLYSSENRIGRIDCRIAGRTVAMNDNVFGEAYYEHQDPRTGGGIDLNGYDQKLKYVNTGASQDRDSQIRTGGGKGSKLTLTGSATAAVTANWKLCYFVADADHPLDLVIDQCGDYAYTQTLSAVQPFHGTVEVKKGTLVLQTNATMTNLTSMTISGGQVQAKTTEPTFGDNTRKMVLNLNADAGLDIADGLTVEVWRAFSNDKPLAAGYFTGDSTATGDGKTAEHPKYLARLAGTGILHLRSTELSGCCVIFR